MAGDWIKVEKVTPEKPEIEAMADLLAIDPDTVFAKCFRVWRWFDDHTENGNAPGVTALTVDRRTGVTGFGEAMAKVGWLVIEDGFARLPNFDRHNGQTAKRRALTAKRVAKSKAKKANAEVTPPALPREEKRREDPPPHTPPPGSGEWAAAEAELRDVGVAKVRATLEAAQSRGAGPADVLALVRHYRESPGAWGVGALVQMIAGDLDTWPQPADDYRPPADLKLAAERRRLDAARSELEATWGDRFRRLPRDRQADLRRELSPLQRRLGRVHAELAAIEAMASAPDRWLDQEARAG